MTLDFSKLNNNLIVVSSSQILQPNIIFYSFGTIRILNIDEATGANIKAVLIPEGSRPSTPISFPAGKFYNGNYGAVGVLYVKDNGRLETGYWPSYHNATGAQPITDGDILFSLAVWHVSN